MRVPTSAIVMTLIVAVPFGFAIRDSLKGNDAQAHLDQEEEEMRVAEAKERDQAAAEQQAQYEREKQEKAEREKLYKQLIGADKATLGTMFDGAAVGAEPPAGFEDKLSEAVAKLDNTGENYGLQLHGDGRIASVSFPIGEAHCDEMKPVLAAAWGEAPDDIWIDLAHKRRASLSGLLCVLHFDQIVDDATWVKNAMPKLVGKTPQQAAKLLGAPTVPLDEPTLSWYLPGPPNGHDSTELSADVDEGKIVAITSSVTVTDEQARALIEQVGKQLHAPPVKDEYGDIFNWEKQAVTASYASAKFRLIVGK
jgi:hypothetical protein